MGSAASAIATKLQTRADLVWDVPEGWSLAEAATVPTAYMTAYYSLVMRGRLVKGMRVLVHAGTGAVGMAAIQLCLSRGAEVRLLVWFPGAACACSRLLLQPSGLPWATLGAQMTQKGCSQLTCCRQDNLRTLHFLPSLI